MFFLLFGLWILFNGKITLEICLFGVAISGAIYWFAVKMLDYDPKAEWRNLKKLGRILRFLAVLFRDIFKASFHVIGVIWSRKKKVDPKLVFFYTDLQTDMGRVALANAITLTPGTITVSMSGQELLVHCLDRSLAEGMEDSQFVRLLEKLEGENV